MGINWNSGYKLLKSDYESGKELSSFPNSKLMVESNIGGQYSAIVSQYPGNEFEEQPSNYYPKTNFMATLVNVHMLPEE